MESVLPLLKDFGFPIALCGVLLLALRHMFTVYDKAQKARIGAIEAALTTAQERLQTVTTHAAERADGYTKVLQGLLSRHEVNLTTHNALTKQTLEILRQLVGALGTRPCLWGEYTPHPHQGPLPANGHTSGGRIPTPAEVPQDPITERTTGRA